MIPFGIPFRKKSCSAPPQPEPALQFDYVKLSGGPKRAFRYEMSLAADGTLTVSIDDLGQKSGESRHERKTSPALPPARIGDLAAAFRRAGFLSLEPLRKEEPRSGAWSSARISALETVRPW